MGHQLVHESRLEMKPNVRDEHSAMNHNKSYEMNYTNMWHRSSRLTWCHIICVVWPISDMWTCACPHMSTVPFFMFRLLSVGLQQPCCKASCPMCLPRLVMRSYHSELTMTEDMTNMSILMRKPHETSDFWNRKTKCKLQLEDQNSLENYTIWDTVPLHNTRFVGITGHLKWPTGTSQKLQAEFWTKFRIEKKYNSAGKVESCK